MNIIHIAFCGVTSGDMVNKTCCSRSTSALKGAAEYAAETLIVVSQYSVCKIQKD
jgi:hypothetical protein